MSFSTYNSRQRCRGDQEPPGARVGTHGRALWGEPGWNRWEEGKQALGNASAEMFCLLLPEGKGLLERDTSSPAASRAEPLPPIFLSCGAGEHLTLALRNLKNASRGVI